MFKPKRLLVPVDFTDESSLALDWAIMLAKNVPGASITLCHVLGQTITPVGPEAMVFDRFENEKRMAEAKLQQWQQLIPAEVISNIMIVQGRHAPKIVDAAQKDRSDLILLTTHGRRGLSRMLRGSVSEEVVRESLCPVLVLHLTRSTVEAVHDAAKSERLPE